MTTPKPKKGKLRIGDDWNAITIIALSQSNPLKAVAEFVENSIDAGATEVEIIRGREKKEAYLRIRDNGRGIPRDKDGLPNFKYVATHICDSIKRQLKVNGSGSGLQGEFGIGLLSFWTVGETLLMRSPSDDGRSYEMRMAKGDPNYTVAQRRTLFAESGTELTIKPLLSGLRHFSGEKIQWYLASELRDRIRQSNAKITVTDRQARKQFVVEPRKFDGRLLTDLPETENAYLEIYLAKPGPDSGVGLYRSGTRVLSSITDLDALNHAPWNSPYLQGIVDAPSINLTPGTRMGVIQDEYLAELIASLKPAEAILVEKIEAQQRAEEERASKQILRTITKAFREALITLPAEEYDWFDLQHQHANKNKPPGTQSELHDPSNDVNADANSETDAAGDSPVVTRAGEQDTEEPQKQFFDFTGPLATVRITPASSVIKVDQTRTYRAVARDNKKRQIDREVLYQWRIVEGTATLTNTDGEVVSLTAPSEPGLIRLGLTATEGDLVCEAEALVTVTETLMEGTRTDGDNKQGLPAYSFQRSAGELWRSRYDNERNLIIVNSGHRDFVYASKTNALKLRYICRLYAKELVLKNFPGMRPDQLLERMLEISLYTEENLR